MKKKKRKIVEKVCKNCGRIDYLATMFSVGSIHYLVKDNFLLSDAFLQFKNCGYKTILCINCFDEYFGHFFVPKEHSVLEQTCTLCCLIVNFIKEK